MPPSSCTPGSAFITIFSTMSRNVAGQVGMTWPPCCAFKPGAGLACSSAGKRCVCVRGGGGSLTVSEHNEQECGRPGWHDMAPVLCIQARGRPGTAHVRARGWSKASIPVCGQRGRTANSPASRLLRPLQQSVRPSLPTKGEDGSFVSVMNAEPSAAHALHCSGTACAPRAACPWSVRRAAAPERSCRPGTSPT